MGASSDMPPAQDAPQLPHDRCEEAPERAWGWAIQLYALRSSDSWGIGDLADLRRFARWSRAAGASLILLSPLGAQTPRLRYESSPYYASSRRFRNMVFLRIEEVEGADAVDLSPAVEAASRLNEQRIIDYDAVFRIKTSALEEIFRAAPDPRGVQLRAHGDPSERDKGIQDLRDRNGAARADVERAALSEAKRGRVRPRHIAHVQEVALGVQTTVPHDRLGQTRLGLRDLLRER